MGTCLAAETSDDASQARRLLDGLGSVFGLADAKLMPGEAPQPARCMTAANVKQLAREYYTFNEWAVSALGVLWREIHDLDEARRPPVARRLHELESFLLASLGSDPAPLEAFDWEQWSCFEGDAERGKALFLDTMGFASPDVMCGTPCAPDIERVAGSFRGRLRPRHHALARLAREGRLPFLVTTNYDLLLEGAYRLAGFTPREGTPPALGDASVAPGLDDVPVTSVPAFSRIAGADQFLARGDSYRTALLLKIHGCVENYREARARSVAPDSRDKQAWARYLTAMVFTYREIQTWRADAWSRDLIRTLLRTHTLALCGYSGADPVMHSTFRQVYEEMAALRSRRDTASGRGDRAPVFFFDVADKREFYSLEILRAATQASGYQPSALVD